MNDSLGRQNLTSGSQSISPLSNAAIGPMVPAVVRVLDYHDETHDTYTIVLERPKSNDQNIGRRRGQFNMLYAFGVGEVPISLSGDGEDLTTFTHTIRAVGAVTRALGSLRPGDSVGVRGTFGSSWPLEITNGRDMLLVAGGNGLAPLRPAIYHAIRHRENLDNVSILAGFRTPQDVLFADQLKQWSKQFDLQVLTTVDHSDDRWHGRVGVVTSLLREANVDPAKTIAMVCGPEVMMRFTIRELEALRIDAAATYLAMERNMQCAVGFCGHCQFGPNFVCMDGPVFRFDAIRPIFETPEA